MAYDIKIKGLKDLVREEDHIKAMRLKNTWEAYKTGKANNSLVQVGTWEGAIADIGYFNEVATRVKSDYVVNDTQKEFLKTRREFLSKSLEDKINHLNFFRLLYWGFTRKNSESVLVGEKPIEEYVKNIQKKFFTCNPNRTMCDPVLFKPLIKNTKCHANVLSLIEGHVMQDKYWARRHENGSLREGEPEAEAYERSGLKSN